MFPVGFSLLQTMLRPRGKSIVHLRKEMHKASVFLGSPISSSLILSNKLQGVRFTKAFTGKSHGCKKKHLKLLKSGALESIWHIHKTRLQMEREWFFLPALYLSHFKRFSPFKCKKCVYINFLPLTFLFQVQACSQYEYIFLIIGWYFARVE